MNITNDNKKPKICMIVQQRDVKGGIAAVTNGYYGSTLERDCDIRYIESYCDGSKLKKTMKALRAYKDYKELLKDFQPDLVHIHSSFGGSFYRMQPFIFMAKKKNIPVVDHCHGADYETFFTKASNRKKKRIRKVFSLFSKVIVLSDEWKGKLLSILPEEKLVVINNYCKPQSREFVQGLLDERFKKKQVLFLGELGKRKGGYDFAGIIRSARECDNSIRFVFAGSGTLEDEKNIKESIVNTGLSRDVSFPGWVRDEKKKKLLEESAVFLLPSYQEGLPMAILDSMAYGLPVVSTLVGGIPQLVRDDISGFACKAGDTKEIGKRIAQILSGRDEYEAFCMGSLDIATNEFGFDAHINKLKEVYNEVLAK